MTMGEHLTDCELWLSVLNHRYSGRFPTDLWIRPEPREALIEHYGVEDFDQVMDILGITRKIRIDVELPFGTPGDVRNEVRGTIDNYGENGGLVIMPSNTVGFDVPIENIIAFFETARDYFPY